MAATSTPNSVQQPAQQTSLGNQAFGMVPGMQTPDLGLYLRSSLFQLPQNAARTMTNLRWNGIAWTTENIGYINHRSSKFNGGAQFMEMREHTMADGSSKYVMQVGTAVYNYDPTISPIGNTEATLFTAASQTIPSMVSFSPNYFIYCNGVDAPQVWNGTAASFSNLSGWPITDANGVVYNKPNLCASFNGRFVAAGVLGQKQALIISDFQAPGTYTITSSTPTAQNGGIFFIDSSYGAITSLHVGRIAQQEDEQVLMIGCSKGFMFMTGSTSAVGNDPFKLVGATKKFSVPSNRCWFYLDDDLWCFCSDGLRPFKTNTTFGSLINATATLPVYPLVKGWGQTSVAAQAFALDNPDQQEVTIYYSQGADTLNQTALIVNYGDYAPSGFMRISQKQFPPVTSGTPSTYTSPSCGLATKGRLFTGGFNGMLHEQYQGSQYNGIPAKWAYGSAAFFPSLPAEDASARGFWIIMEASGGGVPFQAQSFVHMSRASNQNLLRSLTTTSQLQTQSAGSTILGQWVLGQSSFGGSQFQRIPFYPKGAGAAWEVLLTGDTTNGDVYIVGIFGDLIAEGDRG